jgi:hypothetical protein
MAAMKQLAQNQAPTATVNNPAPAPIPATVVPPSPAELAAKRFPRQLCLFNSCCQDDVSSFNQVWSWAKTSNDSAQLDAVLESEANFLPSAISKFAQGISIIGLAALVGARQCVITCLEKGFD